MDSPTTNQRERNSVPIPAVTKNTLASPSTLAAGLRNVRETDEI